MGNENSHKKQNDIINSVNKSNPILSDNTKNKPLKIQEGKIIQNFNNYQKEYDSLNKNLEKLKNKMSIVLSNDAIELIQKRLEELNKIVINPEIQNSISSFYSTYKSNLRNYYNYIDEIRKTFKNSYLTISNVLIPWLKEQKEINIQKEKTVIEDLNKNMNEVVNNFGKFEEVKELINKICYFELDYKSKEKYNLIDQYYQNNKEEIDKNYKFENLPQFRSLINLRDLLIESIEEKNSFAQIIEEFHKEYLDLYKIIIENINSAKMEKFDMVNEFNEFNGVIIYHRLIRSTEEKLKLVKFE
jgi:hypothetical protein